MPWIVLVVSAVFEAVWATALGMSEGFTRLVPTLVFFVALTASMAGLGWAAKHIPIGTAYAVWVGIGAALTVLYAMATGGESVSAAKIVFLTGIIAAVVGLKLVPGRSERDTEPAAK
ncbi:DMT family transporter [Marinitenerispora sediminis]|uniref:Ligand-binding protein SH3 n=1 Tax=Marinitenerispora sediminis TaxID=1931232 RepID=A0A368TA26_9ACTN|nr:multidrug efflux SMR transporter [Marinitenerispora sediminis]RCV58125.1 ligand-binding protein SH3 [Marinitenerispora sediminis]RCV58747.1 ligand-binding protein SH3 [Marinitenerispora sediminis]RCV61398.1 ligand-binding protein SH3 [Marinitenerispora sediminis]